MLSKCANPGCAATFLYLHQGKLYRLDTNVEAVAGTSAKKPSRRVEFFWLCNQCAVEVTLGYKRGTGITVVPLPKALARAAPQPRALTAGGASRPRSCRGTRQTGRARPSQTSSAPTWLKLPGVVFPAWKGIRG